MRGPKGELPKGVDGSYGTSLPLWKCMWDGSDVIIAWKQNGHILDPDHGYPVRPQLLKLLHNPQSSDARSSILEADLAKIRIQDQSLHTQASQHRGKSLEAKPLNSTCRSE